MSVETTDPVVRAIHDAKDDEQARKIEAAALVETDKGPHPGDPEQPDDDG